MIDIAAALLEHVAPVAEGMRAADRAECAAVGLEPMPALEAAFKSSAVTWTASVAGEPMCIFGVGAASFLSREGSPWLLGTDLILAHQLGFLRRSRAVVAEMLGLFPRLANVVDARNAMSIRWLRWLGFRVGDPFPFGLRGEPFRPFEMEA